VMQSKRPARTNGTGIFVPLYRTPHAGQMNVSKVRLAAVMRLVCTIFMNHWRVAGGIPHPASTRAGRDKTAPKPQLGLCPLSKTAATSGSLYRPGARCTGTSGAARRYRAGNRFGF